MDAAGLSIKLLPSRQLARLLTALHALAATALAVAALPWFLKGMVWLMLAGTLLYSLKKYAWLTMPDSVVAIRWFSDGVQLVQRDQTVCDGQILADTSVWTHLIVLRVRLAGKTVSLSLLPDCADATDLRQLRIRLIHAQHATG